MQCIHFEKKTKKAEKNGIIRKKSDKPGKNDLPAGFSRFSDLLCFPVIAENSRQKSKAKNDKDMTLLSGAEDKPNLTKAS